MKYNKLFVTAALTAAVTLGSCVEETQVTPEPVQKVYKASMEDMASADTRTSLKDESDVVWSEGDRIMIFEGKDSGKAYEIIDEFAGKSSGDFAVVEGISTEGSGAEFGATVAYYPYDEDVKVEYVDYETYSISNVLFPSEQVYRADSFGKVSAPMVAINEDGGTTLRFMNVGGLIKFSLNGELAVSRITLRGNDGELLSGKGTVTSRPYYGMMIEMAEDASTEVALVCDPAVQLSPDTPVSFYISIPPTEFEYGFELKIDYTDGNSKTLATGKYNYVNRSSALWMPTVEANVAVDGLVDAEVTQVYEYYDEVFDYEIWDYVTQLVSINEYSQVAIEVKPSSDNWTSCYMAYLDEDIWERYGSSDELLKNYLIQECYPMSPEDITFPYYEVADVGLNGDPVCYAVMFADETGALGKVAKIKAFPKKPVYSDISFTEGTTTNIVDGVLKNVTDLRFTPVTNMTASHYKYVWVDTYYYNYYEDLDDSDLINEIAFYSSDAVTVKADELIDGQIIIPGHEYDCNYFLAIVPFDADGNIGNDVIRYEYECALSMDGLSTSGQMFEATMPEIVLNLPSSPDDVYYYYDAWSSKYYYEYSYNVSITPKEGTTVAACFADADDYSMDINDDVKAMRLWEYYYDDVFFTNKKYESSQNSCGHYSDTQAPDIRFIVSWFDKEGNVYFKEYPLQTEFQKIADQLNDMLMPDSELPVPELPEPDENSPDKRQWMFTWEEFYGTPSMIDIGVTTAGYLTVAFDAAALYGEEDIPEELVGVYLQYFALEYNIIPTDETSGVIQLRSTNSWGEVETTEATYSGFDGTTMKVTCDMLMLEDVVMTASEEMIPIYIE